MFKTLRMGRGKYRQDLPLKPPVPLAIDRPPALESKRTPFLGSVDPIISVGIGVDTDTDILAKVEDRSDEEDILPG